MQSLFLYVYLELFSSDTGSAGSHSDFAILVQVERILIAIIANQTVPQLAKNDVL